MSSVTDDGNPEPVWTAGYFSHIYHTDPDCQWKPDDATQTTRQTAERAGWRECSYCNNTNPQTTTTNDTLAQQANTTQHCLECHHPLTDPEAYLCPDCTLTPTTDTTPEDTSQ